MPPHRKPFREFSDTHKMVGGNKVVLSPWHEGISAIDFKTRLLVYTHNSKTRHIETATKTKQTSKEHTVKNFQNIDIYE